MKLPLYLLSLIVVFVCSFSTGAQTRRVAKPKIITAVVMDETLSLLRTRPSLFAGTLQRMRRGRQVRITAAVEADGVKFFKVTTSNGYAGWIQSEAVFGKFRPADEQRLALLVHAAEGFDKIELAEAFLDLYPASRFRPAMLLLVGDLLEEAAAKLSRDASSRLNRRAMSASGAPVHSYYLNFNLLDRYRRAGVTFVFNPATRSYHYDGASWREIVVKFPLASEASEARVRLETLRTKLETSVANN